jgi:sugar/nucleoside kinase (ribokinase family)
MIGRDRGDVAPVTTLRDLCKCCDYAIFSQPALSLATGAAAVGDGLRRMQEIAGGMVGVTLGADGFLGSTPDTSGGRDRRCGCVCECRRSA